MKRVIALLALTLVALQVQAEGTLPWAAVQPTNQKPRELEGVGITEKLGQKVDLSLTFKDETGATVPLSSFVSGRRPLLLSIVYYDCPNLCNLHLNGMVEALKKLKWTLGNEFDYVLVSMDPKETSKEAVAKKEIYMKEYGRPEGAKGWHFLTGTEANVKALADQVGFSYKWDNGTNQWAHTSAAYVLTPAGKISRYLYGIQFPEKTVRLSLVEASDGVIGDVVDRVVLFCFHYDPDRRTYAFYAFNLMRVGGALTVGALGYIMYSFWWRQRRKSVES